MTAVADVAAEPRAPRLDRAAALRLAETEYRRFSDQLRTLAPEHWSAPTACPAWDVHAMVCHVLGMAEFAASPVEGVRQARAARRAGGLFIDGLTAVQQRKHRHRSPAELTTALERVGPRAARGRARVPALLRARPLRDQPVDERGLQTEDWRLGYLLDVVLTRDTWMHRSDIAAATGRPMELTRDHDGVLVADVVEEWAQRHGAGCTLTLTGPAGGTWTWGANGPSFELDGVEFCRLLSGRGRADGLLATRVPF